MVQAKWLKPDYAFSEIIYWLMIKTCRDNVGRERDVTIFEIERIEFHPEADNYWRHVLSFVAISLTSLSLSFSLCLCLSL